MGGRGVGCACRIDSCPLTRVNYCYFLICIQQDATLHSFFYLEQFPDKINRATLHLVGRILEYYDARTRER
jgi:hypothetical protein